MSLVLRGVGGVRGAWRPGPEKPDLDARFRGDLIGAVLRVKEKGPE